MEFVEGETLENLIKRAGQLELKAGAGNCGAGWQRLSSHFTEVVEPVGTPADNFIFGIWV